MNAPAMSLNTNITNLKTWIQGLCSCELGTANQALNDIENGSGKSTGLVSAGKEIWHASAGVIGSKSNKCTVFYILDPNQVNPTAFIVAIGQHSASATYSIKYKKDGYWTYGNAVSL